MDHYTTKENKCRFSKPIWQTVEEYTQVSHHCKEHEHTTKVYLSSDPNSQRQ